MKGILRRLLYAMLAAVLIAGGAQAAVDAKVTRNNLPVFDSTSFSEEAYLGSLNKGTVVSVLAVKGAWAKIELNGRVGYTGAEYLDKVEEESATRVKGYANQNATVYKSASASASKLGTISKGTAVYAVGVSGKFCRVQNAAGTVTGYVYTSCLSKTPPSDNSAASTLQQNKAKVIKLDWFDGGSSLVDRGCYYHIYDIKSGQLIRVKYTTGTNHMDLEPATAEDTAKLKRACGGWSWERRPVILIAEGRFIAASINCMPHGGEDTLSGNDMDGVICLHMTNSRTHGSDNVDEDHQAAINAAYNWAHG